MGEDSEERSGRIAGIVKSIFGRKKGELPVAPPPSPPQEIKQPPDVAELNLIKEKVQSVSRPAEAAGGWKQPILSQAPPVEKMPQTDIALKGHDAVSAAQALAKPRQQDAVQTGTAAAPEQAIAKHVQQDNHQTSPASDYKKSRLDEVRKSIEESAQRKDPAHLKKNIEKVNEHLHYVRRKSAISEKKIEKMVDERVREELGQMHASVKRKLASNPPREEREQLEGFQQRILELMDVSDKKSQLEMEQIRSQMDSLHRQISAIPSILAQKEIDELSPLKEEVAVLRGELRKALPNVSDAGERAKLEGTIARVEAISKMFGSSPQQEAIRSELGDIRAQMSSIAGAVEKSRELEAGIDSKSLSEFGMLKQEMEEMKAGLQALPAAIGASESRELGPVKSAMEALQRRMDSLSRRVGAALPEDFVSLRDELRSMRNSVKSTLASSRSKEESEMISSLQKRLDQILGKEGERSAAEFGRLERSITDVKRRVSGIPEKIDGEKPEFEALRSELRSLNSVVDKALSQPKDEEEKNLLRALQSRIGSMLEAGEARSLKEMGELRGELADIRRRIVGLPSRVEAGERPEFDAVKTEVLGLQRLVGDALSRPRDEEERKLLSRLQSRLEELSQASEARSVSEFGKLEGELADVREKVSRIPSVVGARERPEFDSVRGELADVREKVSRIPSVVGARERSEFDSMRGEIVGLQRVVGDALSRPRDEEERKLLSRLQSRLEGLLEASQSRSVSEFGRLEGELAELRSSVSRIPSVVGAREKPELDAIRGEVLGLHKVVSDALAQPKDEEEKNLLKSLQSRLEGLLEASQSRSVSEFGKLEGELADVRTSISRIPSVVGARERSEFDSMRGEIVGLQRVVGDALSRPRDEEERKLLSRLQSRLEELSQASEARNASEFGRLEGELADVRTSISRIPSVVGAREKSEMDSVREEILGLKRVVSSALARPLDEYEKNLLSSIHSRLEALMRASESRSTAEFGKLEGELADIRARVSRMPSLLGSRERADIDFIQAEIGGLKKVVADALSKPRDEMERRFLNGLQSRLEGLLEISEANSLQQIGGIKKELADVRRKIADIPSRVEAGEKPELGSMKGELQKLRSEVEAEMAKPKGVEEREMLKSILSQLDGMVKFFDLRAGASIDAVKSELDSVAGEVASSGKRDKELMSKILSRLSSLSSSIDAKTGSAAEGIRAELEDMKNQLTAVVSAEQPEVESMQFAILSLRDLVEKAVANSSTAQLDKGLNSLKAKISEMMQLSETRTESGYWQLRQNIEEMQKVLEGIPAELAAEKPEIDSIKSAVTSLKRRMGGSGSASLDAIKNRLDGIAAAAPKRDSISDIREGIASLRTLLEKRTRSLKGPAKVQVKKRKGKKAGKRKPSGRASGSSSKKAGMGRAKKPHSRRGRIHLKLKKKRKLAAERAERELKKVVSSLERESKTRGLGRRGRSDIESFISQLEKKRANALSKRPEIERRLGGEYSAKARREKSISRQLEDIEDMRAEREPPAEKPPEKEVHILPHGDYESYLKEEKLGRIGSDVKRMHARLKDIRKLYEEEF